MAAYRKNRDQLRNPTLANRVWATFTFLLFSKMQILAKPSSNLRQRTGDDNQGGRAQLEEHS